MRAYETQLEFSGKSGHAVVVDTGKPWRFVFWDKAQYVGCVDVGDGVWFTPEWCETNSPNDMHCYEPIMDKQLRWSRVRILETGPARARVQWSYALCDMRYRVFHGNTRAEETYTVYPDGIAVRQVVLWPGTENAHGGNANFWQMAEWILVNSAGSSPLEVLQVPKAFTMWSGVGDTIEVPWPLPAQTFEPFCNHYPQVAAWPMYIGKVNLKRLPNPFVAFSKDQALFPHMPCPNCQGDHPYFNLFPGRNLYNIYKHWPVTDMEDFIQWVPAGDDVGRVATHTSFIDVNFATRRRPSDFVPTPAPGTTWYLLVGATAPSTDGSELTEMARSYRTPAQVEIERDEGEPEELHRGRVLLEGYDYGERAYCFRKHGQDRVALTMTPTERQVNPVFVINGWSSPQVTVTVDGEQMGAGSYQSQICGHDLIIWVEGKFDRVCRFEFVG